MLLSLDYYVTDTDAILAVIFESFKKGMTLQIFLHYIYVVNSKYIVSGILV